MKNRSYRLIALGLACGGLLLASALPAAAQPGGPCTLVSDDALSAALGAPAQAVEAIAIPGLVSCGVVSDANDDISIMHITAAPDALLAGGSMPGMGEPSGQIEITPAAGLGYSAEFLRIPVDGDTLIATIESLADHRRGNVCR